MRLGEVKMELLEDDTQTIKDKKTQDKIIEKEKQIKNKTEDKEDNKTENKKKQTKFEIPNNVSDISKLKEILETNPGNTIITI